VVPVGHSRKKLRRSTSSSVSGTPAPPGIVQTEARSGDGETLLEGAGHTLAGQPVVARVRFFDITPTSFEWENRVSLDGGATWYRDSTISARRA